MIISCKECGKVVNIKGNQKFCSDTCRRRNYYKTHQKIAEKACVRCGKLFTPSSQMKNYCSMKCRMDTARPKLELVCPVCGKVFLGRKGTIYCSSECRYIKAYGKAKQKAQNRPEKRDSTINEINAQARANGMSYGQFKALQYMQEHKTFYKEN